ncbi:MAG: CDP-alcohol phosphatidyltransferase family protein [Alphaproteobacteria bacterium]|nr:CDP-alcohol phosphatidyltransferase family protein [Alphaproteobacteria bacterium]
MAGGSWSHVVARALVRPLVGGPVTPNHLTTARLATGIAACAAFAVGTRGWDIVAGVVWVISALLDRADGELARLGGTSSKWGHAYDYYTDVAVNGLFFVAIGFGLRHGALGAWTIAMGLIAGITVAAASIWSELLEQRRADGVKAYEGFGGFDFDDVMYLFAPVAWLGWLLPLLAGAAIGGPVFALVTWIRLRRTA